jgi:hypothetical protein
VVNTSGGVLIPVKDSLSIGESYQYGDSTRLCEATVYDYKVLPFYCWWFIDYNRFVVSMPENKSSYLVVFVRIENLGTKSALVPSAEKIQVTSNGQNYTHKPYFEKSVLSASQIDYYSSRYNDLPYQWIRELGQDKRDYAFLTGYNIFGEYNFTSTTVNTTATVTPTSTRNYTTQTTSTGNGEATNGKGFFIKPGPGNAIDGYLIFELPDTVKRNLSQTYVDIAFKANSGTRWRLEPAG